MKKGRTPAPPKPKGKTPWKRGPVAYEVAQRASDLLEELDGCEQSFFSLRDAAQLLGISTQPLREWHRDGWLVKGPLGLKFPATELRRFVQWLARYAKLYPMRERLKRFRKRGEAIPRSFEKLRHARYHWPKGRKSLRPRELAELLGCHPSLVTKAIAQGRLHGRKRNKVHWKIFKNDNWFFF